MSILIRDMEMPKDCMHCFMPCEIPLESDLVGKRKDDCPLVEVPSPHGRLIDAKKLEWDLMKEKTRMGCLAHISKDPKYMGQVFGLNKAKLLSIFQQTIIEAEGERENE